MPLSVEQLCADPVFVENSVLLCVVDLQGRVVRANPAMLKALRVRSDVVEGHELPEWLEEGAAELYRRAWEELQQGAASVDFKGRMRNRLGEERHIRWGLVHRGDSVLVSGSDITSVELDRQAALATAQTSEQWLRAVAEQDLVAVVMASRDGAVLSANAAFARLLDVAPEALVGQHIEALRETSSGSASREVVLRNGTRSVWVLQQSHSLDRDRVLHTLVDLTARKAQEAELEEALRRAEEAGAARDAFLRNVSHELRTPLNGVLGLAHLLMTTPLNRQQREYLELLEDSGRSLLTVVDEILRHPEVVGSADPVPFELEREVAGIVSMIGRHTDGLTYRGNPSLRGWVEADVSGFGQLLDGMVQAAAAMSRGKGIKLIANRPEPERLVVDIRGLGLSVMSMWLKGQSVELGGGASPVHVNRLIEQLGGRWTPRVDGVTVEVPVVAKGGPMLSGDGLANKGKVLIAEDSITNQVLLRGLLGGLGFDCEVVGNGAEAVERVRAGDIDIVLMDCRMPVMDGFAATEAIRALEKETGREPMAVIAVTAHALPADRRRCFDVGMDDYLTKPVRLPELRQALSMASQVTRKRAQANKSDGALLDSERIEELEQVDPELASRAVTAFSERLDDQISGIAKSLKRGDAEVVERLAHTLKGAAANVGAKVLSEYCRSLEARARTLPPKEAADAAARLVRLGESTRLALAARVASPVDEVNVR